MMSSADEGKAENVVYLEFSKAFHVVSHRILVSNFIWSNLDRQKTDWIIGQKHLCSVQRLVTVELLGGLSCLISLSMTWRKRRDAVLLGLQNYDTKWRVWLIRLRSGLPFRGIYTCWRLRPRGTSWNSVRTNRESFISDRLTPCIPQGITGLAAALLKRTWEARGRLKRSQW